MAGVAGVTNKYLSNNYAPLVPLLTLSSTFLHRRTDLADHHSHFAVARIVIKFLHHRLAAQDNKIKELIASGL